MDFSQVGENAAGTVPQRSNDEPSRAEWAAAHIAANGGIVGLGRAPLPAGRAGFKAVRNDRYRDKALGSISALAEDAAMGRIGGEADKVRRYGEFCYAAKSWRIELRVIARVEAGPQGADSRFIVTNLRGLPKALYEKVYCARGQAENLIKAHKLHLASDRTSCSKATANQFRLLIHTAAYWLMLTLRRLAPRTSFWHDAQFDTIDLCLIKVAGRVTEMVTRIKIALPSAYPLPARLRHARRPHRHDAAVNYGAACPRANPSAQPQTPSTSVSDATKNHIHIRPSRREPVPLMNDPGLVRPGAIIRGRQSSGLIRPGAGRKLLTAGCLVHKTVGIFCCSEGNCSFRWIGLRQAGFRIARQMAFDTFCPRRYPICRDETLIVPGVSSKTALLCLNRICASDGVDTQKIAADVVDDVEDRVLPLDRVIALARKSGLQLRSATLDWRALLAGTATKTVLLVLRNANVVLVLGSGRDGVEEVVVSDPLYQSGEPFFLPRVSLERSWGGETLILKRKRRKVERTLALCLSILSICGLAAGLLLVSQAAIDGTLAGSNSLHHETSAAVSSDSSANAAESNDTQSTAARTNVNVRLMNVSEVAQPSVLVSLTASPENGKGISAGEVQKTEQPAIGVQQGSDASTVATPANAQELPQTFEKSGAISAQSPVGEAPQTFTPAATTPTLQTNAVSAKTARLSLSPDEVTALLTRGDSLFAKGDIASARLFYERAAEAGDGQAALRLGESYDPAFLARTHLSGVRGDALAAARWYRRAHELGTTEAETLLRTIVPEKDQRLP